MKHDVLRRGAALLLALLLMVPAMALPAGAADGDPTITVSYPSKVENKTLVVASGVYSATDPYRATGCYVNVGGIADPSDYRLDMYPESYSWITDANGVFKWRAYFTGYDHTNPAPGYTALLGSYRDFIIDVAPLKASGTGTIELKFFPLGNSGHTLLTETLTVNVSDNIPVEYAWVEPTSRSMKVGETYTLTAGVRPAEATNKNVTWSSSKEDVATVNDNGMVTAVGPGYADITVTTEDGDKTATCTVYVYENTTPSTVSVTGVELDHDTLDLEVGSTAALTATVAPADASDKSVTWDSSDEDVATVSDSGEVSGVAEGTATITVTTVDGGKTATCAVTVTPAFDPTAVTGVELDRSALSVEVGKTAALTATVSPAEAANKNVTWSSSAPAVAAVTDGGVVSGVAEGTATITVTTEEGGKTATCAVTVTKATIPVSSIYISPENMEFNRTDARSRQISVGIDPSDATFDRVTWSSSNPAVATVARDPDSRNGILAIVTAVGPGEAGITAEAGGESAECTVVVSGFTLSRSSLTLLEGRSENLSIVGPYGQAKAGSTTWQSSDPSVVAVTGGKLTARSLGTATITATRGSYSDTCVVTVAEDTSCLIRVGKRFTAGEELRFDDKVLGSDYSQSIRDALESVSRAQTGAGLSYVSNLSVSTEQGTVYYNYLSEGDTGSGAGMTEKFYYIPGAGQKSIEKLSFISQNDFSGVAEISYTGYSANRQSFKGVIRVQVGAMYDAFYNTYSGVHITFRASDFNAVCQGLTGRDLSYVTFALPLESWGTLYYNYPGPTQYTEKVTAGAQYRYTSTPSLNNVSFAPAEGCTGTFSITYRGVNTAGAAFTGRLIITVNDPVVSAAANLYYSAEEGKQVVFRPADFDKACRAVTGETLDYVCFTPPPSGHGSLMYDYRGVDSPGTPVTAGTSYYRSGSPAIGSVSFFSTASSPEQVAIDYTGYGSGGSAFRGTVYIALDEVSQQTIRYSVDSGQPVAFRRDDFNIACRTATGDSLNYVRFRLPASSEGVLCYEYNAGKNPPYSSRVSSATSYYYTGGNKQIGSVTFLADAGHAGTVSFTYTGYTQKGASFTGSVVIQVTPATPGQVSYSGTGVEPIRLGFYSFRNACNPVLDKELSYIQFDTLPPSNAGRLYLDHSGYGTGTPVTAGTKYYVAGTPGIDQISFVPRGGYQGTVTIPYTAVSASGRQTGGQLKITVSEVAGSRYFEDMGRHQWAAASVDYLCLNGVTKGMSAKEYGPGLSIRRCDFVVMLCRTFELTAAITDADGFPDVPSDAYYAREVAIAKKLGIVSGDGVNFNPRDSLTRQDAMVIIHNTLDVMGRNTVGAPTGLDSFADSAAVSAYARGAVGTLVQLGLIRGDTNNCLRPRDTITRAEVAIILHSVMTM